MSAHRRASCSRMPRQCSKRIVDEKLLTASGTVGFWPAARSGADDIAFMQMSRATK